MSEAREASTASAAWFAGPARRWGAVALVVLGFVGFAAVLHATRLPGFDYTWLRPPLTAYSILKKEDFPTVAVLVMALGFIAQRRSELGPRVLIARLRSLAGVDAKAHIPRVLRSLGVAVLLVLVASRISNAYSLADFIAILLLGAAIEVRTGSDRTWLTSALPTALYSMAALTLVSYGFTVVKALVFVVGTPVDAAIVGFETRVVGFDPSAATASWAAARPWAVATANWVYYHSFDHLLLQLVFLAALGDREERARYIAAMCLTYVIGGFAYQLMPSLGPIYHASERYSYLAEWAKSAAEYRSILAEHVLAVLRGRGGDLTSYEYVAAMPSLHVAQEAVMTFYARRSRIMFIGSVAFLMVTIASVVVLGWHYPSDCLGGLLVAACGIAMARILRERGEAVAVARRWFATKGTSA